MRPAKDRNLFWPEADRPIPPLTIFISAGLTVAIALAAAILAGILVGAF